MKKFFISLVMLLIFMPMSVALTQTATPNPVKEEMLEPVIKINGSCSAVSIGNNRLLTAAHCVSKAFHGSFIINKYGEGVMDVVVISRREYFYDLIKKDDDLDLAVLQILDKSVTIPAIKFAANLPDEGRDVWIVGYPGGLERTITEGLYTGTIISTFNTTKVQKRIRTTAPIIGGNSGGAVFVKVANEYQLIGIVSAVWMQNGQAISHMNVSIPLNTIIKFLM